MAAVAECSGKPILFIMPARGGSVGGPGKNVYPIAGIPNVGRTARACTAAAQILGGEGHRIICSTDSEEIAECAKRWGAEVPYLRPAELATSTARTIDVVIHTLDTLGDDWEAVVLLQCTSPFTSAADIVGAVKRFREDPVSA